MMNDEIMDYCNAIAHAASAEARAATLNADNAALRSQLAAHSNVNHGLAVAVAQSYEEKLATLRSQLAAGQEWRPVTEVPTETDTLVLMRSYTNQLGYEYKRVIWQNLYENVWENTVTQQPEGYWFSVEEDEDELDIDEWNEWLPLPRWPAPPQEER